MLYEKIELPNPGYGRGARAGSDAAEYAGAPLLRAYCQDSADAPEGVRIRPAVVICPGGGYAYTSWREAEPIALAFLERGYQAFVLDYTAFDPQEDKPLLPYPAYDLARAVALVRRNAEAWHVDPQRVAILGCSAGGSLCALYGALSRQPWFAEKLGLTVDQVRVSAQILCYPVIDFTAGWPADLAYARQLTDHEEWVHAQDLVDAGTPRTFIWATATDGSVPARNTLAYAQALLAHGVDHECHIFHRGRHGLSLANAQTAKTPEHDQPHVAHWFDLALEWLAEEA